MSKTALYDRDFYAWANEQAGLLRAGKLAQADIDHIAEEIESMGKTEKRELISRLTVLLLHMLKWEFQPARRGASWEVSIGTQRRAIARHMADNPSLKAKLPEAIEDAYVDARSEAYAETGLAKASFPSTCPWTFEQMMDENFWPETSH
ncbi:DUF29 domain-containing protein [Acetobacter sp. AN02]|uniref:DUF29 domain-containing protein n=1 Tax=Acetobacter sp. AN02 TaxID=2894186 RepID=UPI0024342FA1|nr:DUF29 domain-containing protein [Acetobacter sp. AN02]MDG6095731.1 DUF29 domain-containing protein [Acetobacter sp. AN02]